MSELLPEQKLDPSQKRAKRVLKRLVRDPDALMRHSVRASSLALLPDDPLYGARLKDLDRIVASAPGTRPDASLAMLATGVSADSEVGAALSQAQAIADERQAFLEQQREDFIQQARDAAAAAEEAAGPMGYVKAFSQTLFAAAEAPFQIMTNVARNAVNEAVPGGSDTDWGSVFANTDLGFLSMGAAEYYTTGKLDDQMLNMGDGFFINHDSPVAQLRRDWDSQMLGYGATTEFSRVEEVEETQPDGSTKKVRRVVNDAPATLGQGLAEGVFGQTPGSTAYSIISGVADLATRAADPSMYVSGRNVTSAFVTGENIVRGKVLGQSSDKLLPSLDNVTRVQGTEGAVVDIAEEATGRVAKSREAEAPALANLTENEKRLLQADEELKALRSQLDESPVPPDAAKAERQAAARRALAHGASQYRRGRDLEGLAKSTAMVYGDEAAKAEAGLKSLRRQDLDERFTPKPKEEPTAVADDAVDAVPAPQDGSVHAVLREDGKFDLIHRATGARVAERNTLEEAELLADDMSRTPGYADDVPLEDLRSWDHVQAERELAAADDAGEVAAREDPPAVEKVAEPEPRAAVDVTDKAMHDRVRLRKQIDEKQKVVDALKEARKALEGEAELLTKKRAGDEAHLMYEARRIAEVLGKPMAETPDEAMDLMRRAAGLELGLSTVDVDKAVSFLTRNSEATTQRLIKSMALIDDSAVLHEMTRGKWSTALRRDVAKAKTEAEVRAVLARHIAQGDFTQNVGRLRGVRIAAQARFNKDPDAMLSRYGQVFGEGGMKTVAWGKQLKLSAVPWANARHIEDADGMADLVSDTATYVLSMNKPKAKAGRGFEDAHTFRAHWIRQMDEAEDGFSRRAVWNKFQTAMVERAGREHGLDDDTLKEFKIAMSMSDKKVTQLQNYLAEARASAPGQKTVLIDGKEWEWADVAALESQLSYRVLSPNWDELRRSMKSAKEIKSIMGGDPRWQDTLSDITGSVFERYWRASVIAFRGAYILRNMGDIQLRMYLKGHPSAFTNPQGVLALAFSHLAKPDTWSGKRLEKLNELVGKTLHSRVRADGRLDGHALMPDDPDGDLVESMAGGWLDLVSQRNASWGDVGQAAKPDQSLFKNMGYPTARVQDDGTLDAEFFNGWEFEVGMMQSSPMARAVLDVASGEVPDHIRKIMDDTGMEARDAVVEYYAHGAGRRHLDQARSGGAFIREATGDPDVDTKPLYEFLFGDMPISMKSRWQRLTLGGDPAVMNGALKRRPIDAKEWRAQKAEMRNTLRQRAREDGYMIKDEKGRWVENPEKRLPVREVQYDKLDRAAEAGFGRFLDKGLDWFFTKSGRFEHAAGYLPEFRYAKWDQAADFVKALSPEDAQILVRNAEEILGGKQLPNSWAASTLRRLKANAKKAQGSGLFKLADLDDATDAYAAKEVQSLFYNALNRNQFAHAIRLLAPFAQPWANTLKEWGRLGVQNPNRVYAAGVVYTAGSGKGSNWLQDDPTNPNDSFFYRHPKSGQMMIGVPGMGPAIAALASGLSGMRGGPTIGADMVEGAVPLQSMNLAIQNSLLPGAGPVVSISAGLLEDTGWYQSRVPDVVKTFLQPYTNIDPDADPTVASTLVPAWLQGILGGALGVPDFAEKAKKYLQPTMGYLMQKNPDGRYGGVDENGNFIQNTDQQRALLRDAETLASALLFGRSVIQNVSPGSPMPEVLAKADDGRILSTTVITQEYMDFLGETGDRSEAMLRMADQYGTGILFTLLPTRGKSITPTDDAYRFLTSNPDAAERTSSTLPLFAPGGGYSQRYDRFARLVGDNPALSGDEMAREVNTLMKVAKEAELDRKLTRKEITEDEHEAQVQALQDSYEGVPLTDYDTGSSDVLRADLKRNAADPVIRESFPSVSRAVLQYERYREYALANNATEGLTGAGNVEWRSWLRKKGAELVAAEPDFAVAWVKAYAPEVREDD